MVILVIIILLVPALISLMCYERFRGVTLAMQKRVELYLVFAFITNMIIYGIVWIRKWDYISWSLGDMSSLTNTGFVFQFMLMSLIVAVVTAYVLSLVRIGKASLKSGENPAEEDTEDPGSPEGFAETTNPED